MLVCSFRGKNVVHMNNIVGKNELFGDLPVDFINEKQAFVRTLDLEFQGELVAEQLAMRIKKR